MRLTFLDTETTGLPEREPFASDPKLGPEIIEYAIGDWEDGNLTDVEHVLVQPKNLYAAAQPPDAEGIYRTPDGFPLRYREDEWKHAGAKPWLLSDCQRVHRRLASGQVLAGSNPGFDAARMAWEIERFRGGGKTPAPPRWNHRMVGTEHLAVFLLYSGAVENRGLVALAQYFGIEHDAHTALGDLKASVGVFEAMVELYWARPKRLEEALRDIAECSADAGMAEFAREAIA